MSGCKKQKKFLKGEREALTEEFEKHRLKLEKELGREVLHAEAVGDFLNSGLEDFAEGYRMGFCSGCDDKDKCRGE